MSRLALLSHRVERIIWTDGGQSHEVNLYSLSFIFSDGTISPPMGTYNLDPTLQVQLPDDMSVGTIEFGRSIYYYDYKKCYKINAMRLFDQ